MRRGVDLMRQHQTGETPKPDLMAAPAMEEVNFSCVNVNQKSESRYAYYTDKSKILAKV